MQRRPQYLAPLRIRCHRQQLAACGAALAIAACSCQANSSAAGMKGLVGSGSSGSEGGRNGVEGSPGSTRAATRRAATATRSAISVWSILKHWRAAAVASSSFELSCPATDTCKRCPERSGEHAHRAKHAHASLRPTFNRAYREGQVSCEIHGPHSTTTLQAALKNGLSRGRSSDPAGRSSLTRAAVEGLGQRCSHPFRRSCCDPPGQMSASARSLHLARKDRVLCNWAGTPSVCPQVK